MENMHADVRVQRVDKILCTKIHGRRAINMMRIPCDLCV